MDETLKGLFGKLVVKDGDLFDATQPLVMHLANNLGYMGAGIAKGVHDDMSPEDFYKYKDFVQSRPYGGLGRVVTGASKTHPDRTYLHVIGQNGINGRYQNWTNRVNESAIRQAFSTIAKAYPGQELAMPYNMGAGLAGGDWQTMEDLVNEYLAPYMNVYAYKIKK